MRHECVFPNYTGTLIQIRIHFFPELTEELALQNNKNLEIDKTDSVSTETDVLTFELKYLGEFK